MSHPAPSSRRAVLCCVYLDTSPTPLPTRFPLPLACEVFTLNRPRPRPRKEATDYMPSRLWRKPGFPPITDGITDPATRATSDEEWLPTSGWGASGVVGDRASAGSSSASPRKSLPRRRMFQSEKSLIKSRRRPAGSRLQILQPHSSLLAPGNLPARCSMQGTVDDLGLPNLAKVGSTVLHFMRRREDLVAVVRWHSWLMEKQQQQNNCR